MPPITCNSLKVILKSLALIIWLVIFLVILSSNAAYTSNGLETSYTIIKSRIQEARSKYWTGIKIKTSLMLEYRQLRQHNSEHVTNSNFLSSRNILQESHLNGIDDFADDNSQSSTIEAYSESDSSPDDRGDIIIYSGSTVGFLVATQYKHSLCLQKNVEFSAVYKLGQCLTKSTGSAPHIFPQIINLNNTFTNN